MELIISSHFFVTSLYITNHHWRHFGKVETRKLDCVIIYQWRVHRRSRLPVFTSPTRQIHCHRIPPKWFLRLKSHYR